MDSDTVGISVPPILLDNLATTMPSRFVDIVIIFRSPTFRNFGEAYMVVLKEERCALRDLYIQIQEFHAILDGMAANAGFRDT